jgi:hypothetical protein
MSTNHLRLAGVSPTENKQEVHLNLPLMPSTDFGRPATTNNALHFSTCKILHFLFHHVFFRELGHLTLFADGQGGVFVPDTVK